MRDQDSADCRLVKEKLMNLCREAGKTDALVRIACRELESFYFGDLCAVEKGLGLPNFSRHQKKAKYRIPDKIANPCEELERLTGGIYQHVLGSRCIAPYLSLDSNTSHSFNKLLSGVQRLHTGYEGGKPNLGS
jgi:hypothetical protein